MLHFNTNRHLDMGDSLADGLADLFLLPCFLPFSEPHNHLTHKKKAIKNVFYLLSLAYKTLLQGETFSQPSPCLQAGRASLFSQKEFGVTRRVPKAAFSFTGLETEGRPTRAPFLRLLFPSSSMRWFPVLNI